MDKIYKEVENCRIFNEEPLEPFFDLGRQPPANSLRENFDEVIPEAPLALAWSEKAKTAQLTVDVKGDYLFKSYVWVTGTSSEAIEHSEFFAEQLLKRTNTSSPFIVEVASNDGTFLKPLVSKGLKVLGIDPAQNIAEEANKAGIPTMANFFGVQAAEKVLETNGKADILFARNVIPHVENIHDVMHGMVKLISDDGIGAIEFHHAGKILKELHYDSIYHEHLFFYSLVGMLKLLGKFNFYAFDVEKSPISGGSLIIYFSKKEKKFSEFLNLEIQNEKETGINDKKEWVEFSKRCEVHRKKLKRIVENEIKEGRTVIGYGASARSSTMLNYCNIDKNHLVAVADKSPYKHYKYTAGTDILILPTKEALEKKPDTILLLAWNFEKEILSELKNQYGFKGRVIVPLPYEPRVFEI